MIRTYIVIAFIFLSVQLQAQSYFNSDTFWGRLQLDKELSLKNREDIDTAIIVASNRARQENDSLRFMSEEADTEGIKYFFVYALEGKWHVLPVAGLKKAISYMPHPNRDWVVYTEGMGKIFTTGIDRGMRMTTQYDVNVILLDYPSIRTDRKRTRNYYFAIRHARSAYKDFVPVLDTIKWLRTKKEMGNGHLSLFFHSMGNIVAYKTVVSKQINRLNNTVWVDNIILNAPCVPTKGHVEWVDKLNFAKRIYIHYNPRDYTLQGAHLMSLKKQLGERVEHPISKKAVYINFNSITDRGHSNFLILYGREAASKASISHYNVLLHGKEINLSDTGKYRLTTYNNIGYDLIPTGS